ncbi:MAG: carbohydrate-binding domain-containing protein [Anaerolineae bacterium]|nr:carbohydrate-binding domain-containing protein [Anaerolineae bacterium]
MDYTAWLPLVRGDDIGSSEPLTTYIVLEGNAITYYGSGATINGSVITITAAGTYDVIGTLDDGQIVIDSEDEETVELVLHGVNITNTTSAPIFVSSADKAKITLADGTENTLTDGTAYVFPDSEEDEPDATLFSKDDLVIDGSGALTVNANYNNGIASKDDLKIKDGIITVNAVNDAIRGKDSIEIKEGTITVNAGNDGLKSNNDEDADKGYISIEDGTLNITAFADGIQAETYITVTGGTFNITAGGGSTQATADSAKGLKANLGITIYNGDFTLDTADDAIQSDGSMIIEGGTLTITAFADGIQAATYLTVTHGTFDITTGGGSTQVTTDTAKGLKADAGIVIYNGSFDLDTADDTIHSGGSVLIEGGDLTFTSAADGVQADTYLTVTGGTFDITPGGGSAYITTDTAKGLKADVHLAIVTGTFTINSADDAVHSNASLTIDDGNLTLASSDDAIHGETALVINGGEINITTCYEGIESTDITINDGTIHMVASDDGINIAGDVEDPMNYHLQLNGGYIVVDADGDGIDVNGAITMDGGTILVHGPTNNGNGALDYQTTFALNGGVLVAAGSSGMAQAPSNSSTQYSVLVKFSATKAANTLFHIEQNDRTDILTFEPNKTYQAVVFSLPALSNGTSYKVYTGGNSTDTETDGLYAGGTYTPGTNETSFTISNIVTTVNQGGGPPGP